MKAPHILTPEEFLKKLDPHLLAQSPLHLDPRFHLLSTAYLKMNPHLLVRAGWKGAKIESFFIALEEKGGTWGYLPVLRIKAQKQNYDYLPSKTLEGAILAPKGIHRERVLNLRFALSDWGYNIQYLQTLTGWSLEGSLFSIFNWFPEEDRKKIIDPEFHFVQEPEDYRKGREILDEFYQKHLENIQDFPAVMKRDQDLFQRSFPEKYRLLIVRMGNQPVGVINYIRHLDRIHMMEFIGNSLFKTYYPKILFEFLKSAKKEKIKIIDSTKFEWCLLPFVFKILKTTPSDISKFLKKAHQMKMRHLREVEE